jgi:tetratricopeptide (TPR) repeat protein
LLLASGSNPQASSRRSRAFPSAQSESSPWEITQQDVSELQIGRPVERQLSGGEVHSYQITLASDQYLRVAVDQRGIDVVLALFGPDGRKLKEADSPTGDKGTEHLYTIAEASGIHRLEVRPLRKDVAGGRYQVWIEDLRPATAQDRSLEEAERAFPEAEQLRRQRTAESRRGAMEKYQEALKLFQAAGHRPGEAQSLAFIGSGYHSSGDLQKSLDYAIQALDYCNQALAQQRALRTQTGEMLTLKQIASIYRSMGEFRQALEYLGQVLTIHRSMGNLRDEMRELYQIARLERDLGNLAEARRQIEAAISIIESVRMRVASDELRASYLAHVRSYYEFYTALLMRLHQLHPTDGYDAAALQASERARARSLLELLDEAHAEIRRGVDPALLERERLLRQLLADAAERQTRLLSGRPTAEQSAAVAKEMQSLLIEHQQVEARIKAASPHYAALTQPTPLSLTEIQQQVLDADTLLLEYALGEERSFLWVVSRTALRSYELPKRAEIEASARRVHDLLIARQPAATQAGGQQRAGSAKTDAEYWQAAAELSRIVLGPAAADLNAGNNIWSVLIEYDAIFIADELSDRHEYYDVFRLYDRDPGRDDKLGPGGPRSSPAERRENFRSTRPRIHRDPTFEISERDLHDWSENEHDLHLYGYVALYKATDTNRPKDTGASSALRLLLPDPV